MKNHKFKEKIAIEKRCLQKKCRSQRETGVEQGHEKSSRLCHRIENKIVEAENAASLVVTRMKPIEKAQNISHRMGKSET